jgi:hypothetical protein
MTYESDRMSLAGTNEYYFTDDDRFLWYANELTGEYYNTGEKS